MFRRARVNGELSAEEYADAARRAAPTGGVLNNRDQSMAAANFFATMALYERMTDLAQHLQERED